MRPQFLDCDVTDDELAAGVAALADGRAPGWRLAGRVEYEALQNTDRGPELCRFMRIWLLDRDGAQRDITLRRLRHPPVWRRVATPGENAP